LIIIINIIIIIFEANYSDFKQSTDTTNGSRTSIINTENEEVKLSKFQESILQAKNQSLNMYLVSMLNYIPVIIDFVKIKIQFYSYFFLDYKNMELTQKDKLIFTAYR
jgi:hypothetical protein